VLKQYAQSCDLHSFIPRHPFECINYDLKRQEPETRDASNDGQAFRLPSVPVTTNTDELKSALVKVSKEHAQWRVVGIAKGLLAKSMSSLHAMRANEQLLVMALSQSISLQITLLAEEKFRKQVVAKQRKTLAHARQALDALLAKLESDIMRAAKSVRRFSHEHFEVMEMADKPPSAKPAAKPFSDSPALGEKRSRSNSDEVESAGSVSPARIPHADTSSPKRKRKPPKRRRMSTRLRASHEASIATTDDAQVGL